MSVDHYENFPVASWLCPPTLRGAVMAIYQFARTADDIADEGRAGADERLAILARYRAALMRTIEGAPPSGQWESVFKPLGSALARHHLPTGQLTALLSAFEQDATNPAYADRNALLDYCARSANPVGRLLMHLAGIEDRDALAQSDAICTALQLVNFWQDLSLDLQRGRVYVTEADASRFGLELRALRPGADTESTRALVHSLIEWARETMLAGAPLVHRMPGRMGWELRFVVQGGLRILEKLESSGCNAMSSRPLITKTDLPVLTWRALRMTRPSVSPLVARP